MKKMKLIGTYALAFFCVLSYWFIPKVAPIEVFKTSTKTDTEEMMLIYMLNKNNQLVPVTLNHQKNESNEETILQLLQLMQQEMGIYDLKALLPVSIKCLGVSIEDKRVQLNFNEAFFAMNSALELRVIEAVVSSIVQLDHAYQIEFLVNNTVIDKMPLSLRSMQPFDYTLGVNNFSLETFQLHLSMPKQIVEYYETEKTHYYVVSTQRFPMDMDDLAFINNVLHQTSLQLTCKQLEKEENRVVLHLNEAFLLEENIVDREKILPLLYTMKMNQMGNAFSLMVNGEEVMIEGNNQKIIAFDDLHLNTFEE